MISVGISSKSYTIATAQFKRKYGFWNGIRFFILLQDVKNRRNPRLVPYALLDDRTKKSNKDSLREAVRTLLGYGYNLEAPDQDHGKQFCCLALSRN